MKRTSILSVALIALPLIVNAAPVLLEAFQEYDVVVPKGERCEKNILELSFSVDTGCYALFTTGGQACCANLWLKLDGTKLRPKVMCGGIAMTAIPITYATYLEPGTHTVALWFECYWGLMVQADPRCTYTYLQAFLMLPDTATKEGVEDESVETTSPETPSVSLVSRGPYVQVTGCTTVMDASGRVIKDAVEDDKVFISNLPDGTYFARSGERTIVKIMKVE